MQSHPLRRTGRQLGYETLLIAAKHLADPVTYDACSGALPEIRPFGPVLVHAVDAMTQRVSASAQSVRWTVHDSHLIAYVQAQLGRPPVQASRSPLLTRLKQAWARLQQTGVTASAAVRQDIGARQRGGQLDAQLTQNVARAAAAPGLRTCALASRGAREAHPDHFKSCAACRVPFYCSKEHQTADWPSHNAACKAARKAAQASSAGAA
jgi:hypothetical protein